MVTENLVYKIESTSWPYIFFEFFWHMRHDASRMKKKRTTKPQYEPDNTLTHIWYIDFHMSYENEAFIFHGQNLYNNFCDFDSVNLFRYSSKRSSDGFTSIVVPTFMQFHLFTIDRKDMYDWVRTLFPFSSQHMNGYMRGFILSVQSKSTRKKK